MREAFDTPRIGTDWLPVVFRFCYFAGSTGSTTRFQVLFITVANEP